MLGIHEDILPSEFKDEARLDSLYAPFRSHSINPRDRDTKISAWKFLISLYCINNGIYSFTLSHLKKSFIRNGRPPSCLVAVLEDLLKNGSLQYLEDFMKESPKSWSGWATDLLIKKPLSWSYSTVKRSLFQNELDSNQMFVHIDVLKEETQKILSNISEKHVNKVICFPEFLKLINKDFSHSQDVRIMLHYLMKEQKVDVKSLNGNDDIETLLIKIGKQDKVVQISEVDIAIVLLEKNEKIFTQHIEHLEDEITLCINEVKSHLLKSHRQLAKACLRKKHEIEKRLNNKISALQNVQLLLEKLKDVHDNSEVLQSYKQALSAFNKTAKDTGLTESAVEDTMLKLGEMLDIHEDIQSAISRSVIDADDEELENELCELIKAEESLEAKDDSFNDKELEEQLARLDISNLPDISSRSVTVREN